mmetsp:Transcript_22709/g.54658  ORF Transcript_22709/g.54658 Transcript_22709/m.54658 type:complete len:226 (+) Transcript_22709:136-813(+)
MMKNSAATVMRTDMAGIDFIRVSTHCLRSSYREMSRSGRKARNVFSMFRLEMIKEINEIATTTRSNTFQPDRRYAGYFLFLEYSSPMLITLITHSIVNRMVNVRSIASSTLETVLSESYPGQSSASVMEDAMIKTTTIGSNHGLATTVAQPRLIGLDQEKSFNDLSPEGSFGGGRAARRDFLEVPLATVDRSSTVELKLRPSSGLGGSSFSRLFFRTSSASRSLR